MRDRLHAIHDFTLRVGLTLAAACLASACASDPVAGVPNLLVNQDAQCDIGPSWNETPIWDQGEVRLIWRYHAESDWNGVCETSGWGCIHCSWQQSERVCTVDLRMRPRFSKLCHMAVLGHELGHALGKMHDEPQPRYLTASFIPPDPPPATVPDSVPVGAPTAAAAVVAAVSPEPIQDAAPLLPLLPPLSLASTESDEKIVVTLALEPHLRLDRGQFEIPSALP
jgi:hypothetical protein